MMLDTGKEIAKKLLDIGAVKVQPEDPFTWASGWKSPIYCDNRKTLSFVKTRDYVKRAFVAKIRKLYPEVEAIAGVATGAIALGVLVADEMDLPFVYVRSKAKGHGMENLIEGTLETGKKVVIIEDLVSTGGSSLKANEALLKAGSDVLGMLAIFTYGFPIAENNFTNANCRLTTLSNYSILVEYALEQGKITSDQVETLMNWRKSPETWGK
jgi:orotate phosphoribosyltransferase